MSKDERNDDSGPVGGGWGCTLVGFVLLGSLYLSVSRPRIGIPLVVVAALVAWRMMGKQNAAYAAHDAQRRALGPPVGDVWRRLLELEGLGDVVDDVAGHVRGALRISTRTVERVDTGRSHVGGAPDLARGMAWPRRDGVPLAFLAQFDLAEVAQAMGESPLPATGHLWFFYDSEEAAWDSHPSDGAGSVVLFDSGSADLETTIPPTELPKTSRFPLCAVTFERYDDMPDTHNLPSLDEQLGHGARFESYIDIREYLASGWVTDPHKLLGFAIPVQDVMEPTLGGGDWRLLLQVESDRNAGMMWGDAGCLYFWIREEDLRARRFDRTRIIFQCH
jgi:hypothetical protein